MCFGKVSRYKYQKSSIFTYAIWEQLEIDILRRVPFMIAPESMKYLGIKSYKYVHYLYATNDKALMNEIKGVNKRRDIYHVLGSV